MCSMFRCASAHHLQARSQCTCGAFSRKNNTFFGCCAMLKNVMQCRSHILQHRKTAKKSAIVSEKCAATGKCSVIRHLVHQVLCGAVFAHSLKSAAKETKKVNRNLDQNTFQLPFVPHFAQLKAQSRLSELKHKHLSMLLPYSSKLRGQTPKTHQNTHTHRWHWLTPVIGRVGWGVQVVVVYDTFLICIFCVVLVLLWACCWAWLALLSTLNRWLGKAG